MHQSSGSQTAKGILSSAVVRGITVIPNWALARHESELLLLCRPRLSLAGGHQEGSNET